MKCRRPISERILSLVLTLTMVATTVPVQATEVFAESVGIDPVDEVPTLYDALDHSKEPSSDTVTDSNNGSTADSSTSDVVDVNVDSGSLVDDTQSTQETAPVTEPEALSLDNVTDEGHL